MVWIKKSLGLAKFIVSKTCLGSYGQHGLPECESTHDFVTNWLYLFLVPLASFKLLQYYIRLGGFRDSRIVSRLMGGREVVLRDSRVVSGLKRFSLGLFGSNVI